VLHRAAYSYLGLDWEYTAIDVTEAGLPPFIAGLDDNWVGLSLTMPLKQTVLPLLATVSEAAVAVGGANTVVFDSSAIDPSRQLHGHNTDVAGIVAAVQTQLTERSIATVGIIGAGATAAAALVAAGELSAERTVVCARRRDAAELLRAKGDRLGLATEAVEWSDVSTAMGCDLVVCTLPGDAAAALVAAVPARPGILLDVTYSPWPTTLARQWQAHGGAVVAGHVMLLWQAAAQVELMTGQSAPVTQMRDALALALTCR